MANHGSQSAQVDVTNAYSGKSIRVELHAGQSTETTYELHPTFGWYDLVVTAESDSTFRYQLAGHVETGEESRTDPAIAAGN
jgi:phospholipase C